MLAKLCLLSLCIVLASPMDAVQLDVDSPYCAVRYRRLCQGKGQHVACQFPAPGPGESCQNYTQIKFTKELRNFVIHYMNRRRQRLAAGYERVRGGTHIPRPEIMMQVEWDRELAVLAQRLADQCSFVHDDCRATVRYPYAGQTVGEVKWRSSSESENQNTAHAIRRVLDAWWGERRRATVKQLIQPFRLNSKGTVWGHFSQLAVWTLRAAGCGAVRHGAKSHRILLVCDFSHTNMLGQRTLVPGALAPCPIHTARRPRSPYPLLCAPLRHLRDNLPIPTSQNIYDPYDPQYEEDDEAFEEFEDDTVCIHPNNTIMPTTRFKNEEITDIDKDIIFENHAREKESYNDDIMMKKHHHPSENNQDMFRERKIHFIKDNLNSYTKRTSLYTQITTEGDILIQRYKAEEDIPVPRPKSKVIDGKVNSNFLERPTQGPGITDRLRLTINLDDFRDDSMRKKYVDLKHMMPNNEVVSSEPRMTQKLGLDRDRDDSRQSPRPTYDGRWRVAGAHNGRITEDWVNAAIDAYSQNLFKEFTRNTEATDASTAFYEPVRHRWRPTRDRPDRPGAKALVDHTMSHSTTRLRANKKVSTAKMKMDKEDLEQMFRDTGFKPTRRSE